MENGDLATWEQQRVLVVLEGVFCTPRRHGLRKRLTPAGEWGWQTTPLKSVARHTYHNIPIDVVTFLGQDVADQAAEWFERYDVDIASVEHYEFDTFCSSLTWRKRKNLSRVVDSDPERLLRYGQYGFQIMYGGEW